MRLFVTDTACAGIPVSTLVAQFESEVAPLNREMSLLNRELSPAPLTARRCRAVIRLIDYALYSFTLPSMVSTPETAIGALWSRE
jgi:hypothetical protein